jgi:SAM domain (Sterile alpha motif)
VFAANAIDGDVLAELTEADFEKIGIPLGDRKRLMRAINALVAESQSQRKGSRNIRKTNCPIRA